MDYDSLSNFIDMKSQKAEYWGRDLATQNSNVKYVKKKKSGCAVLFKFFVWTLLSFVIIFPLTYFVAIALEYKDWEDNFAAQHSESEFTEFDSYLYTKSLENVDDYVSKFALSEDQSDFVELTTDEFAAVMVKGINDSLPKPWQVYKWKGETNDGQFLLRIQFTAGDFLSPWFLIEYKKDDIETIEFFIKNIYLGDVDIDDYGLKPITLAVNKGLREAFLLLRDGNFSGIHLQNIEFEPDAVIIKGVRDTTF